MTDTATTSTPIGANVDKFEEIANLISGEDELPEEDDDESADEPLEQDENDDTEDQDEESEQEGDTTWASALGVDDDKVVLDEEGNFAGVKVKIDGVTDTVQLPDLIAGYQTNKSNTQKAQAIAEQRKEFDTLKTQVAQDYTRKIEDASKLTEYLHNNFLREFQSVDWNTLRHQNPAEYAAMTQDFNERKGQISSIYQALNEERAVEQQRLSAEQQQRSDLYIQGQVEIILEKNPEWKEPEKFKSALDNMSNFVGDTYGFTAEEFANVQDARLLELVKDAQKYRQGVKVAEKKLVKPLPKFQKSAGVQVKKQTKLDKLTKAAKSATGYNKKDIQATAISELLNGIL